MQGCLFICQMALVYRSTYVEAEYLLELIWSTENVSGYKTTAFPLYISFVFVSLCNSTAGALALAGQCAFNICLKQGLDVSDINM